MFTPPLCSLHELKTVYTIDDLLDMHYAMDMYEYETRKSQGTENVESKTNSKTIDGGYKGGCS